MKGMKIVGCAGALALLVAATGASAQEGVGMKSILGSIGIIPKEKEPIVYNERAPLVLPPSMNLPAPAPGGGAEARNGNWPKDPDVAARRKAAAEARTPFTETESYKLNEGKRLSIDEMRAARNPNNIATTPPVRSGSQADMSRMTPDELRSFSKNDKVELEGDGLERRYLSDPPGTLLKAQGGGRLKASADPVINGDPEGPQAFIRQQQERRRQ
ncbi:hypothetical protein [Microvirga splendida]|uniref:DUF3035 domain-containing protein n=1 Tax=Microvirga splendida TaxID=2795727 RepID=A0ABS0XWJ2_9HYPH|nr:hypothetical protein [Microvirga splendida]MBJ6124424.1 hypothetical protein [Microvirga splendida]